MASSSCFRAALLFLALLPIAVGAATAQDAPTELNALPEARANFDRALDTWIRYRTGEALPMFAEASQLDPEFALARVLAVGRLPYQERSAELDRAIVDAAEGPPGELLLAAAAREAYHGNTRAAIIMRSAATELIREPRLRLYAAWNMPAEERQPVLRELMRKHPDFAPAAAALGWTLVPSPFATVDADGLREAQEAARKAVRLEPESPYTHVTLGQVLARQGERAEARRHLEKAVSLDTYLGMAFLQLAQMDLQDGQIQEARETLQRAAASEPSDLVRRDLRQAIALTHLHEGDLRGTLRALESLAEDVEEDGFEAAAGGFYADAAIIAAGAEDADAFDQYRALAEERLPASSNPQWLIIGPAFLNRADEAAAALDRYLEMLGEDDAVATEQTRQRMRGYVALAEARPEEAVAHFQRAGRNPYSQLGLWEAHRRLGNEEAAAAAREDMLTRKDFTVFSTATPIARYRARHMK